VSQLTSYWKIITPASRKQLYTTLSTDAYNPKTTDLSSMTAVTWYSQVMRGPGSRMQSYTQYNIMDADVDIARSLDIIAEEMTGKDEKTQLPLQIVYNKEDNQDISDTTAVTLRQAVRQWSELQDFNRRLFGIARTLIKYGDCFFQKSSDTKKWKYIDPVLVYGIEIDKDGNIINYHIKRPSEPSASTVYGTRDEQMEIVPAAAIIHFTMSDEMGDSAPFGQSVLRPIFRVYRQLSMIEDAVIIYRIVRAPERRVFYIDVGNMPPQRVKQYLEQVKNEIRQKRVPGSTNNGQKSIVDGQYDPQCLALDTKVPLLDGRILPLSSIIEEYQAGKKNWVYSCDPVTGEIKPGEVAWAGITRRNAQVVKVTLDNGEVITCTPDHRFPVQGKGFVQAKDLTPDMSLVPFNRRWVSNTKVEDTPFHQGYEEVFDVSKQRWVKTHQLVNENVDLPAHRHALDEKLTVVHHLDFNKHNNAPSNLVRMGMRDHLLLHSDHNADRFHAWPVDRQQAALQQVRQGLQNYWDTVTPEAEAKRQVAMWKAHRRANRPQVVRRSSSYSPALGQRLTVNDRVISLLCDKIKEDPTIRKQALIEWMSTSPTFMSAFREVNAPSTTGRRSAPTWTYVEVIKEHLEAKNFAHLKHKLALQNHKIRSIEFILQTQDTGCLTVGENVHNWHTFALAGGVFVANSIQEDMFFPVTATGRGSRVETLPGGTEDFGTNLLKYFQEKISRGLRIPTSYMGGAEGAGAQYNDGKVGIAYIEELRFAKFVMRLQDRLEKVLDQEFKIYLKVCGLKIDDEIFFLKLPDPANFALYRQAALDADLIGSFNNIEGTKYLSKRFILKRYLGLTDDELQMNEVMLKEERGIQDGTNVSPLQQIYDPSVYENREAVSVEAPEGGMVGGSDSLGGGLGQESDIGSFFPEPTATAPEATPAGGAGTETPAA
jgi:hypothetical protein